jgi:hypothetical protein
VEFFIRIHHEIPHLIDGIALPDIRSTVQVIVFTFAEHTERPELRCGKQGQEANPGALAKAVQTSKELSGNRVSPGIPLKKHHEK